MVSYGSTLRIIQETAIELAAVNINIEIIDVLGKQVFVNQVSSKKKTIDLSRLVAGVYFVRITDRLTGRNAIKRVLKN